MARVTEGTIFKNSDELCCFIEQDKNVKIDRQGNWKVIKGKIDNKTIIKITEEFLLAIKNLEKEAVVFDAAKESDQKNKLICYLNVADKMKKLSRNDQYKIQLDRQAIALKYRMGLQNGGIKKIKDNDKTCLETYEKLKIEALKWKQKHPMYSEPEKVLTPRDLKKLLEAARYTDFANLVLKSESAELKKEFFSWAIRDNGNIKGFILFPNLQKKLNDNFLSRRLGRFGDAVFKVGKFKDPAGVKVRDARLRFEGAQSEWISAIRGKNEVRFTKGSYNATIKEVFNNFGSKNAHFGHFEIFEKGIRNWNVNELGYWDPNKSLLSTNRFLRVIQRVVAFILRNPIKGAYVREIDFTKADLFSQLPIFETISIEKAKRRFGSTVIGIDGTNWILNIRASRHKRDLDVDGCHGFFEVGIPTPDGKSYRMYPIGKFAEKFPPKWRYPLFIGDTVRAKFAYPDENVFLPRQHARYTTVLDEKLRSNLVERIKHMFVKSSKGFAVFQFGNENCAYEPQALYKALFPNDPTIFESPVHEARPGHPMLSRIWKKLRESPKWLQPKMVIFVQLVLGTWRGRFVKEIDANGKWHWKWKSVFPTHKLCLPPLLHQKIEKGHLPNSKVWYGNPEEETAIPTVAAAC